MIRVALPVSDHSFHGLFHRSQNRDEGPSHSGRPRIRRSGLLLYETGVFTLTSRKFPKQEIKFKKTL
jgi:hypothetical protein